MTGSKGTTFTLVGLVLLLAGLAVFVWERTVDIEADIELLALPPLLLGLFLFVEGYLVRRKERLTGDNPK